MGLGITELLADRKEQILDIAAQHGAYNVRVFGSIARGEATQNSDIDFLVDIQPERTLLDLYSFLRLVGKYPNFASTTIQSKVNNKSI